MSPVRPIQRLSLRAKLLLITVSVLVLGGSLGAWLVIASYRDSMLDAARASNEALAATISEYGAAPLVFDDAAGAEQILGELASNEAVVQATLFGTEDRVLARYQRKRAHAEEHALLRAEKPVMFQGNEIGRLELLSSTSGVQRRIALVVRSIVIGSLALIVLCAALALRLQRIITDPLAKLAAAMQRVGAEGRLGERLEYGGRDEVGVLYQRFNVMLEQLEQHGRERDRTQRWLRTLIQSLPDRVLVFDAQGQVIEVSGGLDPQVEPGQRPSVDKLLPARAAETLRQAIARTLEQARPVRIEYELDTGERSFEAVLTPLETHDPEGGARVLAVSRDVTERKRLEEQFQRAQKLEAVGQLAGGIAHDFNNLLAGIVGYAELMRLGQSGPESADAILEISERASDLVRQLLRFSRKEPGRIRPTDVNELVQRVAGILRHTLDPRIQLKLRLSSAPCTVRGDASQLESALLNMALNARDAMHEGGELSLSTEIVALDALAISGLDCPLEPGPYVQLAVVDTGAGIPPEAMEHIFEPFFTTKEAGKGTGLGLAAVYGTVAAHQGGIHVRSEVGKGTSFRLFLPFVEEQAQTLPQAPPIRGTGRLLLVDDEDSVRETASRLLTGLGYSVKSFARPYDALAYFEQHHAQLDGVILDMLMPQLNGAELLQRLRQIRPDVPVLIASGFLGLADQHGPLFRGLLVVRKPFNLAELAAAVHQLLQREEVSLVQA